jgi:peptide/nickel transport system permease protein
VNNTKVAVLEADDGVKRLTNNQRLMRAFLANKVAAFGLIIVLLLIFSAIFANVLAPHDPNKISPMNRLVPPSSLFWLGTDEFGRDIFSRLLYGARVSLVIAFIAQSVAISLGIVLGLISGWFGGIVDDIIMRITDAVFAIPGLMFLIVWVAVIDNAGIKAFNVLEGIGLSSRHVSIFFALGLIGWAADARMMRSQVLSIKEREYVIAARAMGASNIRIMFMHLLPNALGPTIVLASLGVAGSVLAESTLSFLGLGVEIPNPSWGTMIDQGRNFFTNAWWYAMFPGLTIMLTVLGFNFVGDGLRDALDPRLYR